MDQIQDAHAEAARLRARFKTAWPDAEGGSHIPKNPVDTPNVAAADNSPLRSKLVSFLMISTHSLK